MAKCISCGEESEDGVKFLCPDCKEKVFRCNKCRGLSIEYQCKCGFLGP